MKAKKASHTHKMSPAVVTGQGSVTGQESVMGSGSVTGRGSAAGTGAVTDREVAAWRGWDESNPIDGMLRDCMRLFHPGDQMTGNQWAETYGYLSAGVNAEPGKWRSQPYQVEILNAMTDPNITQVTFMKSARVGYTCMLMNAMGYYIEHDPSTIMFVQPTIADAEDFSKENIDPLFNDTPAIREKLIDAGFSGAKRKDTIVWKKFQGGYLFLTGSNSPRSFRRRSVRCLFLDEVDAYPPESGREGDPINLAIKRTETFWNRKIVAGSTPTTDALSRIDWLFREGDMRRYWVPCPHCGEYQTFVFKNLKWPEDEPEKAHFECVKCAKAIEHKSKMDMLRAGEWRPEFPYSQRPFTGHASFHLWSAYSVSPNAAWEDIAREFLKAKDQGPRLLKTFVNTWLGETWKDTTDAPDWNRLYARRERYDMGTVPNGAKLLTAGVDVQRDRLECEVTAWGDDLESWVVGYYVFQGDTADINGTPWQSLSALAGSVFISKDGREHTIKKMFVDAGFEMMTVIRWCKAHGNATAIKGYDNLYRFVMPPKAVDVKSNGKLKRRGARLYGVGSSFIKRELYGFFRLPVPTKEDPVPKVGFCHFGDFLDEWYFKMLTSEVLERSYNKAGQVQERWNLPAGRRNEALDCRVYSRAAAYLCGVDNMHRDGVRPRKGRQTQKTASTAAPAQAEPVAASLPAPRSALRQRARGTYIY